MEAKSQDNHRVIAKISYDVLGKMLFPDGTRVIAALSDAQSVFGLETIDIVLEHPDLPKHHPDALLRVVSPRYREISGQMEFIGWDEERTRE